MALPSIRGNDTIHVGFHRPTCAACSSRPFCTRAKTDPREITLRPRPLHEALQNARRQQETEAGRARYGPRAGVEGTLSQAVRAFSLRRCRYKGTVYIRAEKGAKESEAKKDIEIKAQYGFQSVSVVRRPAVPREV
ncbi:MAG: transposase [Gammaproteobacteria bacterium]|nr:transposase [Gammaproteobacteria bacterium]